MIFKRITASIGKMIKGDKQETKQSLEKLNDIFPEKIDEPKNENKVETEGSKDIDNK
jgi:hypothetical protein